MQQTHWAQTLGSHIYLLVFNTWRGLPSDPTFSLVFNLVLFTHLKLYIYPCGSPRLVTALLRHLHEILHNLDHSPAIHTAQSELGYVFLQTLNCLFSKVQQKDCSLQLPLFHTNKYKPARSAQLYSCTLWKWHWQLLRNKLWVLKHRGVAPTDVKQE